jgi:D-alanine-D-alanine ligase
MVAMRIGVTYDLRSDYLAMGYSEEETAEFDSETTVAALCDALRELGFVPDKIGNVRRLTERLALGERWDGVFNFCEGLRGVSREAQVPALLEAYDVPYVFSDPLTLALTLDKAMCKHIVRAHGVRTPDFAVIEQMADVANISLAYPLFLKPVAEGSGKGVDADSKVENVEALSRCAARLLKKFAQPVLVEGFLPGREFTVGITGSGADAAVLGVSEIRKKANYVGDSYGLENKEHWEDKVDIVGAPALDARAAGNVALAAWRCLRCRDGGRVDIRYDAEGKANFIEVNPLAGLRPGYSDMWFIADREGLSYAQLIGKFMDSFLKRYPALAIHKAR